MALLTINAGSSSLKAGLYADDGATILLSAKAEELGRQNSTLSVTSADGTPLLDGARALHTPVEALQAVVAEMTAALPKENVTAIGHRVVHGGPQLCQHCALTPQVLQQLRAAVHFAPLHLPGALSLIEAAAELYAGVPQFACFDTQFHQTLSAEAFTYALPRVYRDAGVRRYGFHGLSYESVVHALGDRVPQRLVVAHLGSGSSLCAIRNGVSADTSMGLSPDGGVPMATRTGDLDPAVVLLLQRGLPDVAPGLEMDAVETLLNKGSGLVALAGTGDVRDLTRRADAGEDDAKLALAIFTRSVAKTIGSYAAVLNGLDMLVFTGGIGEHSSEVRGRICASLGYLGLRLNAEASPPLISAADSAVEVRVVPADEDGQIARHVNDMLHGSASPAA